MFFWQGSLEDHEILVEEMDKADVVISMVGGEHIANQFNIIKAIKEARTIKDILFQNIEY